MRTWFAVGCSVILAAPAFGECGVLAKEAAAAAQREFTQLANRELDACTLSRHVVSNLPGVLLRFQPHESHQRERRHWQIACDKTQAGTWRCGHPGITRTVLVREPDDWGEVLGDTTNDQAIRVITFATASSGSGLSYAHRGEAIDISPSELSDIDYLIAGGGEFIVAFAIAGKEDVCLQIVPEEASFRLFRVFTCNPDAPAG